MDSKTLSVTAYWNVAGCMAYEYDFKKHKETL